MVEAEVRRDLAYDRGRQAAEQGLQLLILRRRCGGPADPGQRRLGRANKPSVANCSSCSRRLESS